MIKKLIYILMVFGFFQSCSSGADSKKALEDIIGENLDSLSFDELKETLLVSYAQFSMFHALMESGEEEKPQDYSENDERYESPFSLSSAYTEFDFQKGISFSQRFNYPGSVLNISMDVKERDGERITCFIDRVYFNDGTSDSLDVSISSSHKFDMRKIDSLKVTVRYKAASGMKVVKLSPETKKVEHNNGIVSLDEAKYNNVEYNMTSGLSSSFILAQAESQSGKVLDRSSYMSGNLPAKQMKKKYKELFKALEKVAKGVKDDKYKTKDDLLSDVVKQMSKVDIPSESEKYYRSEYYKGNVESLLLYFADAYNTKDYVFTFDVNSDMLSYNLIWSDDKKQNLIIDLNGKEVASSSLKDLQQINSYYYRVLNYYDDMILLLNAEESRLDTLRPYKSSNIIALTDELVKLSYRNKKGVLNKYGGVFLPLAFDDIEEDEGLIIARTKEKVSLFDTKGTQLFASEGVLGEFVEGLAPFYNKNREPVAFINRQGSPVLSLQYYRDVKSFSDGVVVVQKNDKYGCIRKDGSVVIPFVYDEIKDFSHGVTLVKKDGLYGLIDVNNEFIVPLDETGGYSISENFGKRSYYMGGRTYDEKGNLKEEDN